MDEPASGSQGWRERRAILRSHESLALVNQEDPMQHARPLRRTRAAIAHLLVT